MAADLPILCLSALWETGRCPPYVRADGGGLVSAVRVLDLVLPSPAQSHLCPTVPSWRVQDEGVIDCMQILRIGGDDMQVPLPRAEGNRDIDHIGVARPA